MMRAPASPAEQGFTLVELVVALAIFGLLAAAGTSLLSAGVSTQAGVRTALENVAGERRISALLQADLQQAVARPTRDGNGRLEPAFSGPAAGRLMSYVRAGWTNATDARRAELQRVELRLEGGRLIRAARPMLDGAAAQTEMTLADNVAAANVRLRDAKGQWGDGAGNDDPIALPAAAELTLVRKDGVSVRRVFLVGAGA